MSLNAVVFPEGWVWGAATAAYQIEGAVREGGRGASIWDTFSHTAGKTANGDTGDVACDHFHRFPEDIALMRELGLGGYRFSIAWPRIFPSGAGSPNLNGLDFYQRLIDELHAAGITPYATLYHWDLPQALQDRGGWANPDTARRFGEYAQTVAARLGGGIQHWFTINEPWVAAFRGHLAGEHAPGARNLRLALLTAHNLLLAHGEAMSALRSEIGSESQAGIVLNLMPCQPAGDTNADLEAAHRIDGYVNRWFLDALYRGHYPEDMMNLYGDDAPEIAPGDMAIISQPTDVLGVNYYSRSLVEYDPAAALLHARRVIPDDAELSAMGWEVYPPGLYEVLKRVHDDYSPGKLLITENGAAFDDVLEEGHVEDPERERFIHDHLLQAHQAVEDGVPLSGYFVWSLLDNFEWAWGYSRRFGIIYVDYATQERIVKRSGRWYAGVTRENSVSG